MSYHWASPPDQHLWKEKLLTNELCSCCEKLKAENERMRKALEFYADKENWDTENVSPTIWDNGDIDLGKRARQALKGES